MRLFHDPATLAIVAGGMQFLQGIQAGQAAEAEAEARADFLRNQARQEEKQARRDIRDEKEEQRIKSSRARAVLAARGVDLTSETAIGLLSHGEAESQIRRERIAEDSRVRRGSLRARARNVETAGKIEKNQQIFGGAARGFATGVRGQ